MTRSIMLLFSCASYGLFLLVFLYLLAFLANLQTTALAEAWPVLKAWIPYSIDAGRQPGAVIPALIVNIGLIALFGLQHSVMARQGFKKVWTRIVPREIERSIYVLLSSLLLILFMWQWRPMPATALWHADATWTMALAWTVMILGVGTLLLSTFLIVRPVRTEAGLDRLQAAKPSASELQDAIPLQMGTPSTVRGLDLHLLGHPAHDCRASVVRRRHDRIHFNSHPVRGAGPGVVPRRCLRALPPGGADSAAGAWKALRDAGGPVRFRGIAEGGTDHGKPLTSKQFIAHTGPDMAVAAYIFPEDNSKVENA